MNFDNPIEVYIKINLLNEITDIGSSVFIENKEGLILIDKGYGDKYAHAQTQYFPKPIKTRGSGYNYQYINGRVLDRRGNEIS